MMPSPLLPILFTLLLPILSFAVGDEPGSNQTYQEPKIFNTTIVEPLPNRRPYRHNNNTQPAVPLSPRSIAKKAKDMDEGWSSGKIFWSGPKRLPNPEPMRRQQDSGDRNKTVCFYKKKIQKFIPLKECSDPNSEFACPYCHSSCDIYPNYYCPNPNMCRCGCKKGYVQRMIDLKCVKVEECGGLSKDRMEMKPNYVVTY